MLPKKGKSITKDIILLIASKYPLDSGIVYCLSRLECDTVAKDISASGLKAGAYHAGLTDKQRGKVQADWISNKVKVCIFKIYF